MQAPQDDDDDEWRVLVKSLKQTLVSVEVYRRIFGLLYSINFHTFQYISKQYCRTSVQFQLQRKDTRMTSGHLMRLVSSWPRIMGQFHQKLSYANETKQVINNHQSANECFLCAKHFTVLDYNQQELRSIQQIRSISIQTEPMSVLEKFLPFCTRPLLHSTISNVSTKDRPPVYQGSIVLSAIEDSLYHWWESCPHMPGYLFYSSFLSTIMVQSAIRIANHFDVGWALDTPIARLPRLRIVREPKITYPLMNCPRY